MFNSILYSLLNVYVHVKLFFVQSITKLYIKYPKLGYVDKMIRYNMYFGYKWWSCIRSEPVDEQNWIQLSSCLPDSTKKTRYMYHELYCSASDFDENIHLIQYWNNYLKKHNNMHCVINYPLLMIKLDDKYLIHLYTNPNKLLRSPSVTSEVSNWIGDRRSQSCTAMSGAEKTNVPSSPLTNKFSYLSDITQLTNFARRSPEEFGKETDRQEISIWVPSKVKFLNISYTHPDMPNEIILEIPHNMFFVGNHILSAAFVLRMLEYTVGSSVVFDMDYKLKIIDSNIMYFEMDSHEYLELERDTYNLKRIV